MDLYALQMTPKKKDDRDDASKPKEHIFTKEEVIADLASNPERGFFGKFIFGRDKSKKADEIIISKPVLIKAEMTQEKVDTSDHDVDKQPEASVLESLKVGDNKKENQSAHPTVAPSFVVDKKRKTENKLKVKTESQVVSHLDKHHQNMLETFMESVKSGDAEKQRGAIEEIAELRSSDEFECENSAPLNVAIRRELFNGISYMLAYKGGKEVGRVFQLIDMLNLEMTSEDFAVIPTEVLESSEMHIVAVKYLLWCAKEYEKFPVEFEKRISCFVHAGVLTFTEIHELPEIQDVISRDILEYAKDNLKNPFEIERKIYQYSLAGFLNGKILKKSEKIKQLSKGYLIGMMEKHQDRPEDIEKKIKEYEGAGFIQRAELREDEKVSKAIEKLLTKYIRANKTHPRKINMRVKEFYKMGLIEKEAMNSYLKQV